MRKVATAVLSTGIFFLISLTAGWTEAVELVVENSPYVVTGELVIKKGDVLSAEPGVVLEMGKNASIVIEGRVDISGYPKGGEIIFKVQGAPRNANKGFWKGIVIKSGENNVINYAVIQHAKTGITVARGASAKIKNTIITQNKTGIRAEGVDDLSVAHNNFLGNFVDIEMTESRGIVERNFFDGSLTCVKLRESYPQIRRNYFKQAYKNIIESNNKRDLTAGENWWGTTEVNSIKRPGGHNQIELPLRRPNEKTSPKKKILQGNITKWPGGRNQGEGEIKFKPFLKKPPDLREVGVDLMEGLQR